MALRSGQQGDYGTPAVAAKVNSVLLLRVCRKPVHPPPDAQPCRAARNRAALLLGRGAIGGGGLGMRLGGGGDGKRLAGGGGERRPVGVGSGCRGGGAGLWHVMLAMQAGCESAGGRGTNSVVLPRCCATSWAKVPFVMAAAPAATSACAGTRPRTPAT